MRQGNKAVRWAAVATGALAMLTSAPMARAMRYVEFNILLDRQQVLRASQGDTGHESPVEMWRYLKVLQLRSLNGYKVRPDAGQPLQATLKGGVKVTCPTTTDLVEIPRLRLVRDTPSGKWRIAPVDVDRLIDTWQHQQKS